MENFKGKAKIRKLAGNKIWAEINSKTNEVVHIKENMPDDLDYSKLVDPRIITVVDITNLKNKPKIGDKFSREKNLFEGNAKENKDTSKNQNKKEGGIFTDYSQVIKGSFPSLNKKEQEILSNILSSIKINKGK